MIDSCKACFRKAGKFHTYKNTLKPVLGKPFERHFWKTSLSFENNLLGYSKSIFQKESPRG